jgi:glutamine synthetase
MPKPIAGINGSGMHVHQSLFKDGVNQFYDPTDSYKLSMLAKRYMAGQLHHIKALNAVINPLVNSYKRLVVGYEAPVYVAWASRNRSALIRVPRYTPGREQATRCELRCPDPAANPYLVFATMLAAGLDGIEKNMQAPDPVEENIFAFDAAEVERRGIGSVAATLKDAIEALKENSVIRGVLGEHTFAKYYEAKNAEWDDYRVAVSEWELERYMEMY